MPVNEVVPENDTEQALAVAAEQIVAAVGRHEMRTSHNMVWALRAYQFMRERTKKYTPLEAAITIAVASECRGLVLWAHEFEIVAMGCFWPTSNPNVSRDRQIPELDLAGQYLYFDFCFGIGDWRMWRKMIEYGAGMYPSARFVCCHDNRSSRRGNRARGSGRVIVRKIHRPPDLGGRLRNGHHG